MIPRRAGVIPKTAWSEATRMSHATAISSPPPKAKPFSIAITGEGNDSIARIMSSNGLAERSTWASPLPPAGIWVMSYPAQNASPPSPRRMRQRVSSPESWSSAAFNSFRISRFSAFFFAGLERVTVATDPSRSTITLPPISPPFPVVPGPAPIITKTGYWSPSCIEGPHTRRTRRTRHEPGISEGCEAEGWFDGHAQAVRAEGQGGPVHLLSASSRGGPDLPQGQRVGPRRNRAVGDRAQLRPDLPASRLEGERHRGGRHAAQEPRRVDEARRNDPDRRRERFPPEGDGERARQRAVPPRLEVGPREGGGRDDGVAAGGQAGVREAGLQARGDVPRARARPDRRAARPARPDEGPRGVLGEHPDPRVLLLPHPRDGGLTQGVEDGEGGGGIRRRPRDRLRRGRVGGGRHQQLPRVRSLPQRHLERHLAEEPQPHLGARLPRPAVPEDLAAPRAVRAQEIAHVLHHAEDGDADLLEHPHRFLHVDQRQVLRRRDHHGS